MKRRVAAFNSPSSEQLDPLWKASIVDDDHWHYDVFACRSGEKQVGSISSDYEQVGSFDLNDKATWSWHYIRKLGKLGAEAMMYEKFGGVRLHLCTGCVPFARFGGPVCPLARWLPV